MAGASGASGPNPLWLSGLFGLIGMLAAGVRYYFVWVTDRRVIFMPLSMMSSRPKGGVAWSDPRSSVSISDATPAATWSWFKYHRAGDAKPIRMNFTRPWRDDFAQMTQALSGTTPSAPSAPAPPPPQAPPLPPPG